jgi:hypothetical protein
MNRQTLAQRRKLHRDAETTADEAADAYRTSPRGERSAAWRVLVKARALAIKLGRRAR